MKKITLKFFNNRWNVYATGDGISFKDSLTETLTVRSDRSPNSEFRLRKHEALQIPLYTFGVFDDKKDTRPGHGGEWSSRSSVINSIFDVELIEIAYNNTHCAVSVSDFQKLLGDNAKVSPIVSGGETHFEVINPKSEIIEL